MDGNFIISEKNEIILYGAGAGGCILFDILEEKGFKILAFIDERSSEMGSVKGCPVYSIEEAITKFGDIPLIISVKNVFEHSRIAESLFKNGFTKIIYKPYVTLNGAGTEEQRLIYNVHERLVNGTFEGCAELPSYHMLQETVHISKDYLVDEIDENVIVYVPLVSVFEDRSVEHPRNVYWMYAHRAFYDAVSGDNTASIDPYIEYCEVAAKSLDAFEITDKWKKNVCRNRHEVYCQMDRLWNRTPYFFIKNAPVAEWNRGGLFNLKSGKHRATFYVHKNMAYMPIKMNKKDLNCWLNMDKAKGVLDYLSVSECTELDFPVEHPLFYGLKCDNEQFFYGMINAISKSLSVFYYNGPISNVMFDKNIFIKANDWGFCERFFKRCGANVYVEEGKCNRKMESLLNGLLYQEDSYEINSNVDIDVAILFLNSEIGINSCARVTYVIVNDTVKNKLLNLKQIYQGLVFGEMVYVCQVIS